MSNRSRGAAFEKRIQKYFESLGFKTDKARAAVKFCGPGKTFSSPNDFLGCADILAVHPKKPYTLFVQCTLGEVSPRKKKLEAIPWNLDYQAVQIWERFGVGVIRAHRMEFSSEHLDSGANTLFRKTWSEHIFKLKDGEAAPCL